jgi:hypothetical protein
MCACMCSSSGARTLRLSSVDSDSQVDAIASVLPRVEGLEELDVSGMKLVRSVCICIARLQSAHACTTSRG